MMSINQKRQSKLQSSVQVRKFEQNLTMDLKEKFVDKERKQAGFSSHLVMVRPYSFYLNSQTAADNIYQIESSQAKDEINKKAIQEFDSLVQKIRQNHVKVTVVQDDGKNDTPDSIYPNNWISFHQGLKVILYPMYAQNRRKQRNLPLIQCIQKQLSSKVEVLHDYTNYQHQAIYLQGTGSMVLDRQNKIAYAVISQRTDKKLLSKFCQDMKYKECSFQASQYCKIKKLKSPIYHTNVLMGLARHFALVSLELIDNQQDRQKVRETIEKESKKRIIELTGDQVFSFAGNTLTVVNQKGQDLLVMSSAAFNSLKPQQIEQIKKWVKIIDSDLKTIQTNGGGSARCMLAEVF